MKSMGKSIENSLSSFVRDVNHHLMGDFVSMPHDEMRRFSKMESLLQNKISRRFKIRPLDKNDFGYLIEHLHGQSDIAYEEYDYVLPLKKLKQETLVKRYDIIKPTRCLMEENQRYLKIEQEEQTTYVAYFTINSNVGDLEFPSDEIFYYQQQHFTFPIDKLTEQVKESKQDYYTKKFSTEAYIKLLLFAQLHEFESLEEMSDALLDEALLQTLGFESISPSKISRKNREISPYILSNLFLDLVWKIQRYHYKNGKHMPLKIIDSSTFPLNLNNHKWEKFRKTKAGVKLHLRLVFMDKDTVYPE